MSLLYLIASDEPLPERENPHIKLLSLNEAIELGVELDPEVAEYIDDPDEPGVIMAGEDEELTDYPSFYDSDMSSYLEGKSEKKYAIEMEGDFAGHPEVLLDYLKEQLKYTDEIEFWALWIGEDADENNKKIEEISYQEIEENLIDKIDESEEDIYCIKIRRE